MIRILSSRDVNKLLQAYPPTSIEISDQESLVQSRLGTSLLIWNKVLERCRELLQRSSTRIDCDELPYLLDIEDGKAERLYRDLEADLLFSKDSHQVVADSELETIQRAFTLQAQKACVDLKTFASREDVNVNYLALDRILDHRSDGAWRRFRDDSNDGSLYICREDVAELIRSHIKEAISQSGLKRCDLTNALPQTVPFAALKELASEAVASENVSIEVESDRVTAVPAGLPAAENELRRRRWLTDTIQQMNHNGFCVIGATSQPGFERDLSVLKASSETHQPDLSRDFLAEFGRLFPNQPEVQIIPLLQDRGKTDVDNDGHASEIIVKHDVLERELENIRLGIRSHVLSTWQSGDRSARIVSIIQDSLVTKDTAGELGSYLLQSEYIKGLELVAQHQIEDIEHDERRRLTDCVQSKLLTPLQLYSDGIATVQDDTLKQHLEEFLLDHFRWEVVPQLAELLDQQNLLREKSRQKEVNKFKQASNDSKSFPVFKNAAMKLVKKLNIKLPDTSSLQPAKKRLLEHSVRSMRQVVRASDLLQNVIWICLASVSDGLFMSSGKDTSRMIKAYSGRGSTEVTLQFTQWRDLLKSGTEQREHLQEMRELAMRTVEELGMA